MSTRDASRPAAGAGRDAVRTALGVLIGAGLAYVLPEGTTMEVRGAAALVALAIVSPFLAALGKWLRGRGIEGWPFVFVMALLLSGCATPIMVVGDAYYWKCDGKATTSPDGEPTCDGKLTELRGGQLSKEGATAIGGVITMGKQAVGTVIGLP